MGLFGLWGGGGGLTQCNEAGLVVVLVSGPGSDLSEEPVYQGVSRPRWIKRRPWVSSRTRLLFSWWCVGRRLRDAGRRRLRFVV
jgi:hypothetical protein